MKTTHQNRALRAARTGIFGALYAATSLVPISMFIGAPSFLALNLIMTPTMAILLQPTEAFLASLFGGVIALYLAPMQAMFGPYTVLLPVMGATLGSLVYHRAKVGALATSVFLALAVTAYLVKNYPFPYFVVPHLAALGLAVFNGIKRMTPLHVKIPLFTYISTMTEQGMMMIFAVHLIGLPWQVFVGVLPLMIYERLVGTIGATAVTISLLKVVPKYFNK